MSHHHRIIVPAVTDRPTCAGEWDVMLKPWTLEWLEQAFLWGTTGIGVLKWSRVTVDETPAAGRLCRTLSMGGSVHCGLAPWSGQWRRAQ